MPTELRNLLSGRPVSHSPCSSVIDVDSPSPPAPMRRRDRRSRTPGRSDGKRPWSFLRDFWDTPYGKWVTGLSGVAAVLVAVCVGMAGAAPQPTASTASTDPPGATSEPDREPLVGDCLRHDGHIDVESESADVTPPSKPSGRLSALTITECSSPHELEVFPTEQAGEYCGQDAVRRSIGTWDWTTRLVGGKVSAQLCAVGLRAGTRLQTVDWSFTDPGDPMHDLGACTPAFADHDLASVPALYIPCEPGSFLHYRVYAIDEEVAEGQCAYFHDSVHPGMPWGTTHPVEDGGTYQIDCVYQLGERSDHG